MLRVRTPRLLVRAREEGKFQIISGVDSRDCFGIAVFLFPLLSPRILSSQDGPVLGAVGSFSWSGGAFLYPPNVGPTFINMSQENVDMRDSYLGEKRFWL